MAQSKTRELQAVEKERQVIELRRAGATFDDIARAVGYKEPSGAHAAYKRALKRTLTDAGTEELREQELDRLDRMQRAVWPKVMQGDVQAITAALRLMDRRARLLGLDAPTRIAATVETIDAASIDAEVQRLVAMLGEGEKARD